MGLFNFFGGSKQSQEAPVTMFSRNGEVVCSERVESKDAYSTYFEENFNVDGSPDSYDLEAIFNDPQGHIKDIVGYSKYCYRKHGVVMRTMNLYRDFGVNGYTYAYKKGNEKAKEIIKKYDERIGLNTLLKDMIHELALTGNLVCYDREGERVDIYPINMIEVFPLVINNKPKLGYKVLEHKEQMVSYGKEIDDMINSSYPPEIVEALKGGRSEYAELDIENSHFAKINSSRYERYGVSVLLPAFEDISHKNLLKSMEKSISNSVIDKILHVKVGDKDNLPTPKTINEYSSTFSKVKKASTIVTPYNIEISFVEPETNALNEEKFVEVDKDILDTLGVSVSLLRGEGQGSYSDGLMNLTGICKAIDTVRQPIAEIVNALHKKELERHGISSECAPEIVFNDVVIDEAAKTELLLKLFTDAGLPYQVLYDGCKLNFDHIKLIREKENDDDIDDTFKPHSLPFQGNLSEGDDSEGDKGTGKKDEGGRPKSQLQKRKSDPNKSNNTQKRPNVRQKVNK